VVGQENQEGQMCVRLSRPWTGPWEVIKQLSEVVYRIKYCGAVGSYCGVKTRVVHFNQLTPFNGTCNGDHSCIPSEVEPATRPFPTKEGNGPGVIVLEDDVFPSADVGASSEGPGTGQCSFLVEKPSRRPQRDRHPPFYRTILWIFRLLI